MSKKNMIIWDQVQKSDPASVKEVSFGRKFNAINAQHQVMKATEVFGPIGKGWGVRFENFYNLPGIANLLFYKAELWWEDEEAGDNVYSFGISASIATHSNNGKLDDECVKKVATDALTKGLSKLGFNADIFLGLWDDNKYVNTVKEEKKQEAKADQQAIIDAKLKELSAEAKNVLVVAKKSADKGEPDLIKALWADNKPLHNVKGFKAAMTKHGAKAKEVLANKEATDAEAED